MIAGDGMAWLRPSNRFNKRDAENWQDSKEAAYVAWHWQKAPGRKALPGLSEEMNQLRIQGFTIAAIARRFGMLESEVRLLVRKAKNKERSTSSSRKKASQNSRCATFDGVCTAW